MTLNPKWTATIDLALKDTSWDDHDKRIQAEVDDYKKRLSLIVSDWKIFKAQIWTETGAESSQWSKRPMQIGNPTDTALPVLKAHRENSDLIMSALVMKDLKAGKSVDDATFNIQLGLAYAYTRLATFSSVVLDPKFLEYTVVSGDSISNIAQKIGTTQKILLDLNPGSGKMIHPKQKLKYQKAAIQPTSISVTPQRLQDFYNGNGDPNYADKIKYCQGVIAKLKR